MAPVAMAAEKVMGDDPIDAAILTRPADNRLRQRPSSISWSGRQPSRPIGWGSGSRLIWRY